MPAMPGHKKQICRTASGGCMCDPEYTQCPRKSIGHIAFDFQRGYEYFAGGRFVWRASITAPIECTGRRENAYLQCGIDVWNDSDLSVKWGMATPVTNEELERLRKYRDAPASAPAPVPQYERGDLP